MTIIQRFVAVFAMSTVLSVNWSSPVVYNTYRNASAGGTDPVLSGYPSLVEGHAFRTTAGVLDVETPGNSQNSGVAFRDFGPLTGGYFNGTTGCITINQKFSYQAANAYSPVITVRSRNGSNSVTAGLLYNVGDGFGLSVDSLGKLELRYIAFDVDGNFNSVAAPSDNLVHSVQIEWRCAVPNATFNNSDTSGFITVRIDGVAVYDFQNIKLYVSTYDGSDPNKGNWLSAVWFGFDGLVGPVGAVSVTDTPCGAVVVPTQPSKICVPQTSVTTPARNAGCNLGGVGYSATYVGGSGGMPVGPDPLDGERLTGKRALNVWAEVTHANY